jgi:hypothetical protein
MTIAAERSHAMDAGDNSPFINLTVPALCYFVLPIFFRSRIILAKKHLISVCVTESNITKIAKR